MTNDATLNLNRVNGGVKDIGPHNRQIRIAKPSQPRVLDSATPFANKPMSCDFGVGKEISIFFLIWMPRKCLVGEVKRSFE